MEIVKGMKVAEVASATGFSKELIYQQVRDGSLQGFRVGAAIRIPAASVARWLQEHSTGAADQVAA